MTKTGIVRVQTSLKLRTSPGGAVIASLSNGTRLSILETDKGWHKVTVGDKTGYVSADFVSIDDGSGTGFRFEGTTAVAPDGTPFAKKFRKGVFNYGFTTIHEFVVANPEAFPGLSPSVLRVMSAVSANEGKLEAINTWDSDFLTFGAFQWTAGSADGRGELPAMLAHLKLKSPETFASCFGSFGLDVVELQSGSIPRGRFSLRGKVLRSAAEKEELRSLEWAYRFWRAGHEPGVRKAQIEHAIGRLDAFYTNPAARPRGRFVSDYVTSEYGVALLLDQHVNRPAHVLPTVTAALDALASEGTNVDPTGWGFAEEKRLLDLYLKARAGTSMTDQATRAQRTKQAVAAGLASDERGSFVRSV